MVSSSLTLHKPTSWRIVGCLKLLIQYTYSYPPHLEAVFFIPNMKICHAVVTKQKDKTVIGLISLLLNKKCCDYNFLKCF
jgi:hypothetical protein